MSRPSLPRSSASRRRSGSGRPRAGGTTVRSLGSSVLDLLQDAAQVGAVGRLAQRVFRHRLLEPRRQRLQGTITNGRSRDQAL
ncbi:MAG: hypothetical protein QOJ15_4066 [Bradyrhizobium sp.]|jgi:hypothetical protein|nr:hypothetical protein [Bradyrhizobium sp.]